MHRQVVNVEEYLRLIGEKLKEHPLYWEGMSVRAVPHPNAPGGFQIQFLEDDAPAVAICAFAWAQMKVDLNYRLEGAMSDTS